MGEYIQTSTGEKVKLGTCEDMMYVTYEQCKRLCLGAKKLSGNCEPSTYPKTPGLFFVFPNPHFDNMRSIELTDDRPIMVTTRPGDPWALEPKAHDTICKGISDEGSYNVNVAIPCPASGKLGELAVSRIPHDAWPVRLARQKLMPDGSLAVLLRCGWCGQMYRLDLEEAQALSAWFMAEGDRTHEENVRAAHRDGKEIGARRPGDWHELVSQRIVSGYNQRW